MPQEISLNTMLISIQMIDEGLKQLYDEQKDKTERTVSESCDLDELIYTYELAAAELEKAYKEATKNIENYTPYESLIHYNK